MEDINASKVRLRLGSQIDATINPNGEAFARTSMYMERAYQQGKAVPCVVNGKIMELFLMLSQKSIKSPEK